MADNRALVHPRTRKTVAILCVAIVVVAACLSVVPVLPPVVLTALWLILPTAAVVTIRRRAVRCDEQPVSLLAVVLSRAPPSALSVA